MENLVLEDSLEKPVFLITISLLMMDMLDLEVTMDLVDQAEDHQDIQVLMEQAEALLLYQATEDAMLFPLTQQKITLITLDYHGIIPELFLVTH